MPVKAPVSLNRIVEEGLYFLESRCAKAGIEVTSNLAPDLPEIYADASQLHQVLVNLVVNGIQAMPEGGTLTIHIDKGSSAGVKVGMSGTILSGPSGEDPLSGGGFKVVQVLDGSRSVGRCSLSSVGKNTRVAITVR